VCILIPMTTYPKTGFYNENRASMAIKGMFRAHMHVEDAEMDYSADRRHGSAFACMTEAAYGIRQYEV